MARLCDALARMRCRVTLVHVIMINVVLKVTEQCLPGQNDKGGGVRYACAGIAPPSPACGRLLADAFHCTTSIVHTYT